MGAPRYEMIQTGYQNPHATEKLKLNLLVVSNTPEKEIEENIIDNSVKYPNWLQSKEAHDGIAVLIGGGWSANNHIDEIKSLQEKGATIITMNGSSKWCRENGINPDWQCIVDAKEETSELVDPETPFHYFASQCNPKTLERATNVVLCHFGLERIEEYFPEERIKQGGYTLLGSGTTVGNSALSIAFSQGYREMHLFGYDSSYHEGHSHAYHQRFNQFMPTTEVTWAGKTYTVSVAMKAQAEKFPLNATALNNAGCKLYIYGEGLLQTIYNTKYEDLTEREKYQIMWSIPSYRLVAPGEHLIDTFIDIAKPDGTIIDFGCGTGRAGVKLRDKGYNVVLVDFTDNCRDEEAWILPFVQADLAESIDVHGDYGYCTDVMEHIPPEDVDKVINNIMSSAKKVFFQISTVDDAMGAIIGQPLHLTVKPFEWWRKKFLSLGYAINWRQDNGNAALFYIINPRRN